ncbi:Pre-mRNA-processing factor 40 A [Nymphon striatum]|nr:Pre-mRNA-processing factor 40 A [Nymphon striatum]
MSTSNPPNIGGQPSQMLLPPPPFGQVRPPLVPPTFVPMAVPMQNVAGPDLSKPPPHMNQAYPQGFIPPQQPVANIAATVTTSSTSSPAQIPPVTTSTDSAKTEKGCDWTEHKAPDGRTYYYNGITKQSAWDKPDVMKSKSELLLSQCPWKEYKSDNNRVYYHNVITKESKWTMPKDFQDLKAMINNESEDKSESEVKSTPPTSTESASSPSLASIQLPSSGTVETAKPEPEKKAEIKTESNIDEKQSEPVKNEKVSPEAPKQIVYNDRKEAIEAFKQLLKDRDLSRDSMFSKEMLDNRRSPVLFNVLDVPCHCTWDQALKIIANDTRYASLKKLNEKKHAFNSYKTQKAKEEKEVQRLKAKQAKEDLEQFLQTDKSMFSTVKYKKAEQMYTVFPVWRSVPDRDRREVFEDVLFFLSKKEKEELKALRKRNMKSLSEILDSMTSVTYKTTWHQTQQLLLENPVFSENTELLSMDKEDALIVFEEHIRQLEVEEEEEKERERKRVKRLQRKNRDLFVLFLDELHEQGKLTSMSLWHELYTTVSSDVRFTSMLGQPGSTPLDLFKFYVEDLKARFHDEKKIIKEILKSVVGSVLCEKNYSQGCWKPT